MRKSPDLNESVKRLKSQHPEQWKQKVVSCRIDLSAPLTSSLNSGSGQGSTRVARVGEFVQQVGMSLTAQTRCGVVYTKRNQYVAHMQFVEGVSKSDTKARWSRDI